MSLLNYLFSHLKFGIDRRDIVVEIGSGGDPFLRSDILVEKFIEDCNERDTSVMLDRPVIAADGASLPFPDKSIDFIYCSQVLEHVPNPKQFLDELSRVGKRGYIETPHGDYERLRSRRYHLWYVRNEGDILYLKQKRRWNEYPDIHDYFHKITRLPEYQRIWNKYHSLFNTTIMWENYVRYRIEQYDKFDFSKFTKASNDLVHKPVAASTIPTRQRIKSSLARVIRPLTSAHFNVDLNVLICCPLCRGSLSRIISSSTFTNCASCGAKFPVRDSIPYLLKEEASFSRKNTVSPHRERSNFNHVTF